MRILVVEDERSLLNVIAEILKDEEYEVDLADNGGDGYTLAATGIYDLLILDIMLPEMDGLEIIQKLRAQSIDTPVIFLTAKDSVEDRVKGLDAGADDYLVKPFASEELLARIRAVLRRNGLLGSEGEVSYGRIRLPEKAFDGYVDDKPLHLTSKEYELLKYLVYNKEQILTRGQILDRVWGFDSEAGDSVVDLYVHYLRKKLAAHGCDDYIRTVRGVGYMLKRG
jgi:two-component system, OmpR family, response regulator CiaR